MMGTLATVLAGRKIPTFADRYRADVEGDIEDVDGVRGCIELLDSAEIKELPS